MLTAIAPAARAKIVATLRTKSDVTMYGKLKILLARSLAVGLGELSVVACIGDDIFVQLCKSSLSNLSAKKEKQVL